jgi:hypothetical protein
MTGSVTRLGARARPPLRSPLALAAGATRRTLSPPGVIGCTVIRSARRSVRIARHEFARAIAMDHATIRDLELGEIPLFCVPYDLLRQIAGALARPGSALTGGLGELVTAADCDMLVTAMLCDFEDYAEVPPIDQDTPDGAVARELLRWALAGVVPGRYRPAVLPRCLLATRERLQIASIARSLSLGAKGPELAEFGLALAMLTTSEQPSGARP